MFGIGNKPQAPDASKLPKGISLDKGASVSLEKTPELKVVVSWTDDSKDYDVMALVLYHDGHAETVCAVNNEKIQTNDGAVVHKGDVGVGGAAGTETIIVKMNDKIAEIVPFAYSAIENGPGSFREYGVSVSISNGTEEAVVITAQEASSDRNRYTLAFGRIVNGSNITIENLEMYSKNHSEKRPAYINGKLMMDAGVENHTK